WQSWQRYFTNVAPDSRSLHCSLPTADAPGRSPPAFTTAAPDTPCLHSSPSTDPGLDGCPPLSLGDGGRRELVWPSSRPRCCWTFWSAAVLRHLALPRYTRLQTALK